MRVGLQVVLVAVTVAASVAVGEGGGGQAATDWQAAFKRAKSALRAGEYKTAVTECTRALKILDGDSAAVVDRARVLVFHGSALAQLNRAAEARTSLEVAREALEKHSPRSYELAICMIRLAEVEAQDGKPERADKLSSESLSIAKQWPREDPKALTVLEGVCGVCLKLGEYGPAARGALHVLALRRRTMVGSDPMVLVRPLRIAAAGGYSLGDYDVAKLCLREGIDISERYLGDLHPDTIGLRERFLRTQSKSGELDEAAATAKKCERALNLLAKVGRSEHLARLEFALAVYERARGNRAAALKRIHSAKEHLKAAASSNQPEFADCQLLLGRIQIGEPDIARPAFESAAAIYARARGPAHPKSILAKLWLIRAGDGRKKDAMAEAKALLADLAEKIGESHPDVVELTTWLKTATKED